MNNRPRARKVFLGGGSSRPSTSGGGGFGSGSGGGSFCSGSGGSGSGRGGGFGGFGFGGFGGSRRSGGSGRSGCLPVILVALALIFGGGSFGLSNMLGGTNYQEQLSYSSGTTDGWLDDDNTGVLNTDVDQAAREKYTTIKGDGEDTVTLMVYMCGTDLESSSAMATKDINEMINAKPGENVNLILYTGGCKKWQNSTISSSKNQIWQITSSGIKCLDKNAGKASMTKPDTLTSFIKYATKKFPANRTSLILWDHGGGSISGYGYDEKYPKSGSMTLSGIDTALKNAGTTFDFIGFDACLMATSETALMLSDYADYLIASEESEPGIGWYYTNWLSQLSEDSSLSTLETGKIIVDDFTSKCSQQCSGQETTLSVVDLAELSQTVPDKIYDFARTSSDMISDGDYKEVAQARGSSKEFAKSSQIDQVDLVHFAELMDTSEGKDLAKTILSAVKYNEVSSNVANAYGLSIYFPYRTLNKVDSISETYDDIGIDSEYTDCIQKFAQMEASGQAIAGGNSVSPIDVLLGNTNTHYGNGNYGYGGYSYSSNTSVYGYDDYDYTTSTTSGYAYGYDPDDDSSSENQQAMEQLIDHLFSGDFDFNKRGLEGLNSSNTKFLRNGNLRASEAASYINENRITLDDLTWKQNDEGEDVIKLTEGQWSVVEKIDLELFYDDGRGYIDLGLDNIFSFDDDGNLLPYTDKNWLSINGQVVEYYHTETLEKGNNEYVISGYVPIKLNGTRANLLLSFDNNNEQGYIAGVSYNYDEDVTETTAKTLDSLESGDQIQFLCKYYTYEGELQNNCNLGSQITIDDPADVQIQNIDIGDGDTRAMYKITDIYGQEYWTPEMD